MSDEREPVVIDLPGLEAKILEAPETRALSLLLGEGPNAVELVTGLQPGWSDEAIEGLDRIAERARQLADLLRVRRGDRRPLARPIEPGPERVTPAVNLGQPIAGR